MHIESDYEKLIKQGYIEKGTLVVHVNDLSRLEITGRVHENMIPEGVHSRVRHDKSVVIVDDQGRKKKVSHLAFGYNKQGVQLKDGSFFNENELLAAMQDAISKLDSGTILIDKKDRFHSPEELMEVVKKAAGEIIIGKVPERMTNHGRLVSIKGVNSDQVLRKGTMIIGSKDFDIDQGEYVNLDEFMRALKDYMILTPTEKHPIPPKEPGKPEIPDDKKEEEKPIVVRVVKKYKNRLSYWLILLSIIATLLSGLRLTNKTEIVNVPVEYQEQIVQMIEHDGLFYKLQELEYEDVLENLEDSAKRYVADLQVGNLIDVQNGDVFYETSQLSGNTAVIGQGIRQEGKYAISGISIVCDNQIYSSYVDTDLSNAGIELKDIIEQTCNQYHLNYDDINIRVHIGNDENFTRIGWIDVSDLVKEGQVDQQVIDQVAVAGSSYSGEVSDFSGSTITFETLNGPVSLNINDSNGNILSPGSKVVGSDGKEYIIDTLEEYQYTTEEMTTITKMVMEQQEVVTGKALKYSFRDCNLALALAPLVGSLAVALSTRKKNEEFQQNPKFFEFETSEEYQKMKYDFQKAKEEYERTSGFRKILKDTFYRKKVDILQRLDEDQIEKLYNTIINWHDQQYSYSPTDKIQFQNGRIIITFENGQTKDITDIVMPAISDIGKNNHVVTEGMLEEDVKDGIHRK